MAAGAGKRLVIVMVKSDCGEGVFQELSERLGEKQRRAGCWRGFEALHEAQSYFAISALPWPPWGLQTEHGPSSPQHSAKPNSTGNADPRQIAPQPVGGYLAARSNRLPIARPSRTPSPQFPAAGPTQHPTSAIVTVAISIVAIIPSNSSQSSPT
jgi:hypothetical protein